MQNQERKPEDGNQTTNKQNAAKTKTTTTTTELDNKEQNKPAQQDLKTKQAVKVKGTKKITDMKDLKLFLAKKKLERAQNGIFNQTTQTVAASSSQPLNFLPSSAHRYQCDGDRISQTKPAATGDSDIAAKGNTISAGTSDWLETDTRPDSNQ